ncbi:MAG: DUF1573 domain-containing protein [Spirochaetales bacterium]|nr:DUF1573 domain-containing protein [Spirochaetales bacterium]
MMNIRIRFFLLLLLFIGLVAGCGSRVKGPAIKFDSEKYDFGPVQEGVLVRHTFEFTNIGSEPLEIRGLIPACGCTSVGDYDNEVQPGKTGKIDVTLDTRHYDGKITKTVLVGTNIPGNENLTLTLEGTVHTPPHTPDPAASS